MPRPRSIVIFEACYLGAWLLGILNLALTWSSQIEQANIAAAQGGMAAGSIQTVLLAGLIIGGLITLTLWYFVARRGAVVAKWIVVVLFGLGLLGMLMNLARGAMPGGVGTLLTLVGWVMQAVAVAMLFMPDATAWFARRSGGLS